MSRINWIDSLKGLACIIVMITHIIASDPQIGMYANGCGKIGVWLFMLISGMLYAKSSFHQNGVSPKKLLDFYGKKIIRIYPSYFFALFVLSLIGFLDISSIKDNLLFQSAWGHLWYIPVILKFYFIAPLFTLLKQIVDKNRELDGRFFYLLMTTIAVVFAILFPYPNYPENSIQLYWYLPVFIAGIILGSLKWESNRQTVLADIGAIIGILVILSLTPLGRELLFGAEPSRYLQNKYLRIGACWILVILGILYGKKTKAIVEAIPGLRFVSKYSFELYLVHYIILWWIGLNWPMATWVKGLVTIIASFVIAVPLRRGLDWLNEKLDKRVQVWIIVLMYTIVVWIGIIA